MPRRPPRVIVLVGLPGSGKSTWAREQGLPVLSSDTIRGVLADNEDDQTIHRQVFATLRYLLRQRIAVGRPVTCVDATHLLPAQRRPYLALKGCQVEAVFLDTPLDVCKARNRSRDRRVPEEVIDLMAARLIPPTRAEGFVRVRRIKPGMKA